jgi:AraC-like DNA-binding protein
MPSSSVRTFTDPDEYALAMRGHGTELRGAVLLGRAPFRGKLTKITFDRLWMARLWENQPRVHHATHFMERAGFNFLFEPTGLFADGDEIKSTEIRWRGVSETYYQRTTGPLALGGISLPTDYVTSVGATVIGQDLTSPQQGLKVIPTASAMVKLKRLHAAAGTLAEDAPAVLSHPDAARGLEQALIEATLQCLRPDEPGEDAAAQRRHAAIMRRFHQIIEEHADEPIYLPELCKQIGASERTLRVCCQEHLGMGAKRYFVLRRMNMVRRALQESEPKTSTVTEIATRYGFWQFGRLAVEYKALFGEAPSTTLARSTP